jgi:MprA protease rhombosortase-interaction domain-containing protein
MVSGLALLGVILQISGRQGWLALAALLLAIGGLAFQLEMTRRYWNLSMLGRRSRRE